MKKYIGTVCVVFLAGVLGFCLPPRVIKWQDTRRTMESSLEETSEILLAPQPAMSITEKLDLYKKKDTSWMRLASGKNYGEESIWKKAEEELEKLKELDILEIDMEKLTHEKTQAMFFVDTLNSVQSMIVWEILLMQEEAGVEILVLLDDETGKILQLSQLEFNDMQVEFMDVGISKTEILVTKERNLETIAKKWGEYLQLELLETYNPMAGTKIEDDKIKKTTLNNQLRCVYGDEKEMVCFMIKDLVGDIQLSIEVFE